MLVKAFQCNIIESLCICLSHSHEKCLLGIKPKRVGRLARDIRIARDIRKSCPCNIQRFFSAVKIENLSEIF